MKTMGVVAWAQSPVWVEVEGTTSPHAQIRTPSPDRAILRPIIGDMLNRPNLSGFW